MLAAGLFVLRCLLTAAFVLPPLDSLELDEPADAQLDELVGAYFREGEPGARAATGVKIAELTEGQVDPVIEALGRAQLWEAQPAGVSVLQIHTGGGRSTKTVVRVPTGYDETNRWPLILGLHGQGGRGEDILGYLGHVLGERIDEFIVAAPTDYKGAWFNAPQEEAGAPPALLAELRRRYHVDTQRVYVVGYSMGGHGAWTLAGLYPDHFAAAVALAGTFVVPVAHQAYPLLLPNLTNVPVLAVWGEHDTKDDSGEEAPGGGIAGFNRDIRRLAATLELPIKAIELEGVGHRNVLPPAELIGEYLGLERRTNPRRVSHYFRYPEHGQAGWLRQTRFGGPPWTGTQIAVVVTGPTDIDEYITQKLKQKLGYLAGTIEGQRIDVTVRRTASLEILLNDELIDLDQPITLLVGGKKRYEGPVQRRVSTLLETAYRDWDFQRLYTVRLVMLSRSKARQD